ncbi:far upstream element-binding protein 2-like [Salvia hispanica]|uniref:far upstream element-binding protein 2-like n=1 Tax=Salvia hispanica TaxID=49212 RepID=UPI00200984A9|nr:far upstream element-binding protein 2-like [Salvia hispanica]
MADEAAYATGGESNKRKYDDSPPPVGRRSTGFSSAPDSAAPPPSYSNVPPPMNEIELAKQKAQEIAARLLNNVDPSKRARVDNGAGAGGYDAVDTGVSHKHPGLGLGGPAQSASYGYPGPSKKIDIPNGRVGVIIGKGGETIKYLQLQSGAKIQVTRDMDADPNSTSRAVELTGTPDQIAKAEQLINDVLSEADAGGSGIVSRRLTGQQSGADQFVMMIPNNKVGLVIGKGGETIKSMQATTGARIQVIPLHLPPGDMSKERTVQIEGTSEQIEAAKQLVEEVTSENRMRGQSMSGGYSQQGYQARPPTNWGHSGPAGQQPGYGYVQPGAYPGPPQYGMTQPPYSGYPPQAASGGYGAGWDQSSTAPQNQQAAQGGGYDYYNQHAPSQQQQAHGGPAAPTDASGYGYSQAAYSQGQGGYGQDGYGGYHAAQSGYGQQQQNPSAGYDQQQQSYNSAYPTPDGQTQGDPNQAPASAQSYNAGGQPSPNPNYPHQASSQPGYGAQSGYGTQPPYGNYATPQSQKQGSQPTAYAQPQQSPSAQGGAYAQPGYPRSQPPPTQASYAHADSGAQRPPSSGYPAAAAQPGYGQQQPAQYGSAYDATPPQAAQSTGAAKASPPS